MLNFQFEFGSSIRTKKYALKNQYLFHRRHLALVLGRTVQTYIGKLTNGDFYFSYCSVAIVGDLNFIFKNIFLSIRSNKKMKEPYLDINIQRFTMIIKLFV